MKVYFIFFLIGFFITSLEAQTAPRSNHQFNIGIQSSADFPSFNNKTPYIDYKTGWGIGLQADYYWTWIGLGADINYWKNPTKNSYPSLPYVLNSVVLTPTTAIEIAVDRMFYGIGPNFKYNLNNDLSVALKVRGGISQFSNGEVTVKAGSETLNYHMGYDSKTTPTAKIQLDFHYYFSSRFGMSFGAYYTQHFEVKEISQNEVSGYYHFKDDKDQLTLLNYNTRSSLQHEMHSLGAFVGLVYRFNTKQTSTKNTKPTHHPYPIEVHVKDQYTGEKLPNSEVILYNSQGKRAYYGTTNEEGNITFYQVKPDNYEVRGNFRQQQLVSKRIERTMFIQLIPIKLDLEHSDDRYIIEGIIKDCKTKKPLPYATIYLNNEVNSTQQKLKTAHDGTFSFLADKENNYTIYGQKGNYYSQTESLITKQYDRSKNLFINLSVCMEEAKCNKTITLHHINYDFDKAEIRDDAKKELNKLHQFLLSQPNMTVELSSHTDSRGSDDYNLKLSQKRAQSAVDYLTLKGINPKRIRAKGYGETQLLNTCNNDTNCSDEQHEINRRTEFKSICNQ